MSKTYRPYEPGQQLLVPAALQEWLPEDHLAYFISDIVDQLDLSEITARYERERRGGPPYHPRMMVKVLVYGYCIGVASSRRIARRLHEDVALRVLAANNTPDFRTISEFRKEHLSALVRVVRAGDCVVSACGAGQGWARGAGRHEGEGERVQAQGDELPTDAGQAGAVGGGGGGVDASGPGGDDGEDARYGTERGGDEVPRELAFREGRLRKIREAMTALEAEAEEASEQAQAEGRGHPGVPGDKAQRNFTDADSRIMPAPGGRDFVQAYNCQAVVDSAHQVIVAARATNLPSDKQQAVGMVEEAIGNSGAVPREVSADAGYYSAAAVDELHVLGVDPYIAPDKTRHGTVPPPAPRGRIPGGLSARGDAAQVADQAGPSALRPADGDGGTGYSVRSSRAEASGSSCCAVWTRWRLSGC